MPAALRRQRRPDQLGAVVLTAEMGGDEMGDAATGGTRQDLGRRRIAEVAEATADARLRWLLRQP